jgi:DMSO reductase anchor subunit
MDREAEAHIANWEEVRPRGERLFEDAPLVAFTLLGQMAAGMSFVLALTGVAAGTFPALIVVLGLTFAATSVAFFHLGKPVNAWRALNHLRKSGLSREILALSLFGLSGAATAAMYWLGAAAWLIWPTAAFGLGLVVSMAQVYRLRTVPAWVSWRTLAAFFLSAGVLGVLGVDLIGRLEWAGGALSVLLLGKLALSLTAGQNTQKTANRIRVGLVLVGIFGGAVMFLAPEQTHGMVVPLFLLIAIEEVLGRWRFYAGRGNSL